MARKLLMVVVIHPDQRRLSCPTRFVSWTLEDMIFLLEGIDRQLDTIEELVTT